MQSKLPLLLLLASLASPAFAGLVIALNPAVESGLPGTSVIFSGTLTDNDGDSSFMLLNFIDVTFTPPADSFLSSDPNFFYSNVPGTMQSPPDVFSDTYTGPIFEVTIAPNAPLGTYSGTFNILGGHTDPSEMTPMAAPVSFQVNVTPEPAAAGLMLGGLAGLGFASLRRRRRCS